MSKLGGKKNTLYHFIGELIQEGKYAWFVNEAGRFRIKWEDAVELYIEYRAKKNPSYDLNIDRKKASNSFREGLLRRYCDDADGAKEYVQDCQKVGENKKIVEREFQMPSKVFHSLFGTSKELPGDQVDEKLQVCPDSGISDASDTGFEEAMDVSDDSFDMNATGTAPQGNKREDPVELTNFGIPFQICDISNKDLLDSAMEEINNSDSDVNQPEVVQDISPSSGSMEGGIPFHLMLKEALLESDTTGVANFEGIGDVFLVKTNPCTFSGLVPAAQKAGDVLITVHTEAGRKLGVTYFTYVDEMHEAFKLLIKNPDRHTEFFIMWYLEHGITGINSNVALTLGLFGLSDQGSLPDAKQVQSLKVLQLLVYTAAQVGAQQFLEVIFSTSAGKIVFDSYKDRTPLPEDAARANGHGEVAEFLQDVNKRLSKESDSNSDTLGASDWLELVQAVNNIQKQTVSIDEQESSRMQPKDDDNQSGYFADAETSSCGSLDLVSDWSDLEEENGACTEDEDCENATIETGIDNCASMPHYPQEELLGHSVEFTMENANETQLGNGQDNFERLGICGKSSRLKDMRESFSLKKVTLRSGVIRRSLEEKVAETSSCGSLDLVGGWSDLEEVNGACTKDGDCENATIETGIDNCASMPHYPQEELLGNSVEFTMENAATKESFEDETQLGNGQDNFERLGICGESSRLKDMRESFSLKKVTLRRRVMRRSLEEQGNLERCSFFLEPLFMEGMRRMCSLLAERMGSVSQNKGTKRRDDIGFREDYTTEFSHQEKTTTAKRSVGYEGKTFHLMNTSKAKEETSKQCKNHLTKGKQET